MSMNIDRPLDEIVTESRQKQKLERQKNTRNNRRKKGKKGGPGLGGDNKDAPAGHGKEEMDLDTPLRDSSPKVSGGIRKKRRGRGGGKGRMEHDAPPRKNGKGPGYFSDDRRSPSDSGRRGSKGAKVSVSNLDFGVTQSDISELFETVGPLKSARLILLSGGTSSGSAEVVFEHMEDALDAIKQYNNVPLDNKPLKITLSTDSAPIRIRQRGGRRRKPPADRDSAPASRGSPASRDFDDQDDHSVERFPNSAPSGRRSGGRRGGWRRNARSYDRRPAAETGDMYQD